MSPADLARLLEPLECPWWIAGGWAIDLFLGRRTRQHADTDVVVLRTNQLDVQRLLASWQLFKADPPGELRPWARDEELGPAVHDIWCRPHPDAPWRLQLMLGESEGQIWICRRDTSIRLPIADLGLTTGDGVPYLRPEVQLLFKAKGLRAKDEADFAACVPLLDERARIWLLHSVERCHPGHPWIEPLARVQPASHGQPEPGF